MSPKPEVTSPGSEAAAIDRIFREESGKAVATLIRLFRDIDVAEEAVQEADRKSTRLNSSHRL